VEQGWTDALRALYPGEQIYTFWKYFRNAFARDAGLRIDHLLLSPTVAGRLVAAGVDREVRGRERSSDHAPVWIELTDTGAGVRASGASSRRASDQPFAAGPQPGAQVVEGEEATCCVRILVRGNVSADRADPGVNPLLSAAKHSMAVKLQCWGSWRGEIGGPKSEHAARHHPPAEPGAYEIGIGAQPLGQRWR
jgi:hypothetical protein